MPINSGVRPCGSVSEMPAPSQKAAHSVSGEAGEVASVGVAAGRAVATGGGVRGAGVTGGGAGTRVAGAGTGSAAEADGTGGDFGTGGIGRAGNGVMVSSGERWVGRTPGIVVMCSVSCGAGLAFGAAAAGMGVETGAGAGTGMAAGAVGAGALAVGGACTAGGT